MTKITQKFFKLSFQLFCFYGLFIIFKKEKDGLLKSNDGAIVRKQQCINSKLNSALFNASFSADDASFQTTKGPKDVRLWTFS